MIELAHERMAVAEIQSSFNAGEERMDDDGDDSRSSDTSFIEFDVLADYIEDGGADCTEDNEMMIV